MTLGTSLNLVISTRHEAPATPLDSFQLSPKPEVNIGGGYTETQSVEVYISSAAQPP